MQSFWRAMNFGATPGSKTTVPDAIAPPAYQNDAGINRFIVKCDSPIE